VSMAFVFAVFYVVLVVGYIHYCLSKLQAIVSAQLARLSHSLYALLF